MMSKRFEMPDETKSFAPTRTDPSDANLSWAYLTEVLAPLQITSVLVVFDAADFSELERVAGLLDARLSAIKSMPLTEGRALDSIKYQSPGFCFFNVGITQIVEALKCIKEGLDSEKILGKSKVFFADASTKTWRCYHPALPETNP